MSARNPTAAPAPSPEPATASYSPIRAVRGLVFVSAIRHLRDRGYEAAFEASLTPAARAAVGNIRVTDWVPIDLGVAIFDAMDRLDWTVREQIEFAAEVTLATNGVALNTLMKLAGKVGVSPWLVIQQAPRLWPRSYDGGGQELRQLSPRHVQSVMYAAPLVRSSTFRNSMIGAYTGVIAAFAQPPTVTEVASARTPTSITFRISW